MIKKILQGSLVGIGSILPGVSGGMIAAAFNIYSKLIEALDRLTKEPIKAILSIWEYLIGIALGILVGFIAIAYVFYIIPIPLTLLFIGLILGGIQEIYLLAKNDKISIKSAIIVTVTAVLMISLTFILPLFKTTDVSNTSLVLWFFVGILLSVSLIVPGLSGTMLLLMIGYYGPLLIVGKEMIESVLTINFELFFTHFWNVLFVGLGLIFAFIVLGKLLNLVLKKYPKTFYQIILGIIIAAPVNIIASLHVDMATSETPVDIFNFSEQWYMWLIGIILIPFGFMLARLFSKDSYETKEN
ncbi:DUF368 domain-containing protein [Acholeplasma equirhinis]|uniref:undecaprenyl phosphate translocase family protein n=1 Tax=Acholeplasma equirhinis TaxID=555393 RepID=UPI00197ADFD4|nr:DUF368 domain-containing protein [Acholeplasma equirhinis]MBN3490643.1 DUF368 domain-containing protein [Acholeplasma equirhinis]